MSDLLSRPWRIDRRGERIYIDAPDEVCVDICSGTPEDRARVMALLEQVQAMGRLIRDFYRNYEMGSGPDAQMEQLLRAAGVLDE